MGIQVKIDAFQLRECMDFAKISAFTQQGIEFGQHDTADRGVVETARDTMIGKVAEVGVSNLLREHGLHCPVDFSIYQRGEWDDCDIKIFKWDIDIKATAKGKWLLMDRDKLLMRKNQTYNNLPDALISCNVECDNGTPTGNVTINGFISLAKFLKVAERLRKGDVIPNTDTRLQADNYGIQYNGLSNDWEQIISYMYKAKPTDKNIISISWEEE